MPTELPIAGVFVEIVSETAGTMVVSTGFLAAALRALTILRAPRQSGLSG